MYFKKWALFTSLRIFLEFFKFGIKFLKYQLLSVSKQLHLQSSISSYWHSKIDCFRTRRVDTRSRAMFRHVYAKASDTRRKFSAVRRKVLSCSATCTRKRVASLIVHFAGAKCTGQMRQMRVRIRPSIPSLYYQTMQLPIGNAGSEFSRRTSLRAHSSVAVSFFFKTSIWSDAFRENDGEELVPWIW